MRFSFLIFLSGYELFRSVSILAVFYGDLSVGLMLAIFGYLWIMMTPTQDLINFGYALSLAKVSCKRVEEIFKMELEPKIEGKAKAQNPFNSSSLSVELKSVSFSYEINRRVLRSINIYIPPKSKVAIVGPSGSGKTTLANLIVGFYPVQKGEIYYNRTSSKEIDLSLIRENIYLILQNPKLFNDTLEFNLTLGKEYPKEKIIEALEISQLKDVVSSLRNGLKTRVGVDGIKLSGGQRQRVAVARMVLVEPKIGNS